MSVDPLGMAALAAVAVEWLALGWLTGVRFPLLADAPSTLQRAADWSLRLLIGAFLVSLAQLVLALFGMGFSFVPGVLLLAAAAGVAIRQVAGVTERPPSPPRPRGATALPAWTARAERVGWLVLAALGAAALVRALVVPESGWDAYSHWGLRAQAFANAGTLVDAHSEHEYYPPLVPLLEAWLYLHRGQVSIDLGKTIWALVGGAFGVCLGWHMRLALRPALAWTGPFIAAGVILATPELLDGFWSGQADLALTAYLCLATLAVWQWQRSRSVEPDARNAWLLQAAIFAAAAALTKFEGLPRVGLLALPLVIDAAMARAWRTWPALLCLLVPATACWLVWTAFQLGHGIAANAEHVGAFQPLAVGSVLLALLAVFAGVRTGGGVLVAIAAWALSWRQLLEPYLRLLVLVVVMQALGTLAAFLVSSTAPDVEVLTSATRLVEQWLPIALIVGALGLARTVHL